MQIPSRGRILLVQKPQPKGSATQRLAQAGFEIRRASDETEVVELATKEIFDVVVVDLELPTIDGLSLTRRLPQLEISPAVVWLTARYTDELAAQGAEAGVVQLLRNPMDAKALERIIDVTVSRSRQRFAMLRAIMRPLTRPQSVSATDAKNEFGRVLAAAMQDGAVFITKHDAPKAVLVSMERAAELLEKSEPNLQALAREFDELVARMQMPSARTAARHLFSASPKEFGVAALAAARKQSD